MLITVNELYHDTYHFFCKQIKIIFLISISVTCLNIFMDMLLRPDTHILSIIENNNLINITSLLELINNMNSDEKHQLFKYSIIKMIILLTNKTILLASIITLISTVSQIKKESMILSIYSFLTFLPNLFMLNLLNTIIIQLGFMLLVIPGVLLSITLPLSPIILSFKKHGLIDSIRTSINLSWKHVKFIGPGILFWVFGKFILTMLLSHIYFLNTNVTFFIVNITMNILFSILIIYLFRFYMIFLRS